MRALGVTVAVVAVVGLAPARAAVAAGDYPPEIGIGAGQLLIGTATAAAFLALPAFADGSPLETFAYGALAAGPAAVAGMICTFGHTSKHYTGGCGRVVLGAYLGAIAAAPLAWLGSVATTSHFDNGDEGGRDFTSGPAIGFAIGYAVGAAVGATIAWHRSKQERDLWSGLAAPPAAPGAESRRWCELAGRPMIDRGRRAAPGITAPLLTLTF